LALDAAATANPGGHGDEALLLDLFIMLFAAKLFAEIFMRLRQPAMVGEILAGVAIGPYALDCI
jgi:Kef-type K+ transport system membrane component KefB